VAVPAALGASPSVSIGLRGGPIRSDGLDAGQRASGVATRRKAVPKKDQGDLAEEATPSDQAELQTIMSNNKEFLTERAPKLPKNMSKGDYEEMKAYFATRLASKIG